MSWILAVVITIFFLGFIHALRYIAKRYPLIAQIFLAIISLVFCVWMVHNFIEILGEIL